MIQSLNWRKSPKYGGKLSKEIETLKKSQIEIPEMKEIVNQIKVTTHTIINIQDHTEG